MENLNELLARLPEPLDHLALVAMGVLAGGLVGWFVAFLILRWLRKLSHRENATTAVSLHRNLARPIRVLALLVGVVIGVSLLDDGEHRAFDYTVRVAEILLYGVGAWLLVQTVEVLGDVLLGQYRYELASDNFRERKIYTQVLYVKRVVTFLAVIIASAFVLFQFDRVRELGTGLLASAGVAGIIIGVAAQKSLANLLAGFQIAFTQPLRIDDQVVIDGEFGRVEEITLTYVVIKVWDDRRLIVPLNKIIDDTFQNWSRKSTALIGQVLLYLDYGVDLDGLRAEATRLTEADPLWDQRVSALQVTEVSETCMTVRILASAATPGDTFTLRCNLREGLLKYLRANEVSAFPHRRALLDHLPEVAGEPN